MCRGLFEKTRDIGDPVLSVGIDLQRMAITDAARVANRREHGGAFAAIGRMAQQSDLARRRGGELIENAAQAAELPSSTSMQGKPCRTTPSATAPTARS